MTEKEAIKRILDHKLVHFEFKLENFKIFQALEMAVEALRKQENQKWILTTKQFPEVETEVEVTYKWRGVSGETYYNTAREFYSDSSIVCDESIFEWNDWEDCPFDEETGCYMTPKGWFEYNHFTDTFGELVDCEVIAWRPISPPYKDGANQK